jgi:peroxiredoxin
MSLVDLELLSTMTTQTGETVADISNQKPVLLVFLRHFGCQFCREALDDLSHRRKYLAEGGIELVFVHMADYKLSDDYFKKYDLSGVQNISDPECRFYAAFGLVKGSFTQLFGLQSWIRGFQVQGKYGTDVGKHLGDSFQMPGAFMIFEGQLKETYVHRRASDRPDYEKLVSCCIVTA